MIPNSVLEKLKQIQKTLLWGNKRVKGKHDALYNNSTEGGLKSVDIKHKTLALKCSLIQKLYNENFYEWKTIPLRYIHKGLGTNFINLLVKVLLQFSNSIRPDLHYPKLLSGYNM